MQRQRRGRTRAGLSTETSSVASGLASRRSTLRSTDATRPRSRRVRTQPTLDLKVTSENPRVNAVLRSVDAVNAVSAASAVSAVSAPNGSLAELVMPPFRASRIPLDQNRFHRATSQRLTILESHIDAQSYKCSFLVLGTQGVTYEINMEESKLTCSCPDA